MYLHRWLVTKIGEGIPIVCFNKISKWVNDLYSQMMSFDVHLFFSTRSLLHNFLSRVFKNFTQNYFSFVWTLELFYYFFPSVSCFIFSLLTNFSKCDVSAKKYEGCQIIKSLRCQRRTLVCKPEIWNVNRVDGLMGGYLLFSTCGDQQLFLSFPCHWPLFWNLVC